MTDTFPIAAVYSLPDFWRASCTFSAVAAAAHTSLLLTFGNAPCIINSPQLLERFFLLPHTAVLALLQSAELATDAEESVLLLVSGWCEEPMGQACSAAQVGALNNEIRYSRLSCTFLTNICDLLALPQLKREQILELWQFCSHFQDSFPEHTGVMNPAPWYQPRRKTLASHDTGIQMRLSVSVAALEQLLAAVGDSEADVVFKSPAEYAEGFVWTLELSVYKGVLWCAVNTQGVASICGSRRLVSLPCGVPRSLSICIEAAVPFQLHQSYCSSIDTDGRGSLMVGPGGRHQASAGIEWWADYIADGSVCMSASIGQ